MSNEAHKDIQSIFDYISRDTTKYANEIAKNIYSLIYKLETAPYIGRHVLELPQKSYRELIYKNYRIVYDISKEFNTIYIHFIIHTKRDLKSFYKKYIKNNF